MGEGVPSPYLLRRRRSLEEVERGRAPHGVSSAHAGRDRDRADAPVRPARRASAWRAWTFGGLIVGAGLGFAIFLGERSGAEYRDRAAGLNDLAPAAGPASGFPTGPAGAGLDAPPELDPPRNAAAPDTPGALELPPAPMLAPPPAR